jgi:hypothetical protein
MDDFATAKEGFVPLSLRDVPLQTSTVAWADVGGLSETRRVLRETLEWPTKYAAIFKQSPLRLRSGYAFFWPCRKGVGYAVADLNAFYADEACFCTDFPAAGRRCLRPPSRASVG